MRLALSLLATAIIAAPAAAQVAPAAFNMYDIALNGAPVTVDGTLDDWTDAQFIFFSQDKPNFRTAAGGVIQGVPTSPADFSGYVAMKADADNLYFLARVRDEGTPMIATPAGENLAFNYDHLSAYLGLFNIGNLNRSPHTDANGEEAANPANFQFLDPSTGAPFVFSNRTYRISRASDNSGTTLGADYQIYTRALPYGAPVSGTAVQTYSGGLIDAPVANTTAATRFLTDTAGGAEVGYVLEWKVPLASLAGRIANATSRAPFAGIDFPRYTPRAGDVIPFDFDVTDLDAGQAAGANRYMRGGNRPALFRDSFNFGLRGRFVNVSTPGVARVSGGYSIDYKPSQGITVDANTDDWADARYIGFSQDKPNFRTAAGGVIQGVPTSPADFSGYVAMKADADNLYFLARVRDEGTPMIATPAGENLAFNYDHLSAYLGLFNIGNLNRSPHTDANGEEAANPANFQFLDPSTGAPFVFSNRTYRISRASDNSGTTLGADYQIYTRALPYGAPVSGTAVQTYSGGLIDAPVANTTAATRFLTDTAGGAEVGYVLEWKVPLASLAGRIANATSRAPFAGIDFPRYTPRAGDVIPFDFDVTDLDAGQAAGANRYMRGGNKPALFRDSFNFDLRGQFVSGGAFVAANAITSSEDGPIADRASAGIAQPNPFSGRTTLAFTLDAPSRVTLEVFNLLGQRVATLVSDEMDAGDHLVPFDATGLPAGVYVSRLAAQGQVRTARMILVR